MEEEYVVERSLSTLVQPCFYSNMVDCLISAQAAWVRIPAGAKVISIFLPVTFVLSILRGHGA